MRGICQVRRLKLSVMFVLCVLWGIYSQECSASATTRKLNVETHTQDEIRQYIKEHTGTSVTETTYSAEPITTTPYSAGALSDVTLQSALDALNEIRYIAGLFDEVVLDDTYTAQCQAGTLINAVNGVLSHNPTQPSDMDDDLYQLGYNGTSSSNIGWGYSSLVSAVRRGWMADGDDSNIEVVGHRRWCLNPKMGKTGFGQTGSYTAMYSFDSSHSVSEDMTVVWPAQNMPTDYFDSSYPWSISSDTEFSDDVKVVLTYIDGDSDSANDKTWEFSATSADGYFNNHEGGYGQRHCLIFRPDDITMYYDRDKYKVQVLENGVVTLEYTVNFFDLEPIPDTVTMELSSKYGALSEAYIGSSGYYEMATITISDTTIPAERIVVTSSNTDIARAIVRQNSNGTARLSIRACKAGVAQITLQLTKSIKVVYKVTIGDGDGHVHNNLEVSVHEPTCTQTGLRTFECEGCGVPSTEVISMVAHVYDAGVVTTEATCSNEGEKVLTCEVCKRTKKVSLEKKEHTAGEWIIDKEASHTEDGSRHKECIVCNAVVESEGIGKLVAGNGATIAIGNDNYSVSSNSSSKKEVIYSGPQNKSVKSVVIPSTIQIGTVTYRVTTISANAFENCKQLKTVKLGKNITKIGKNAFSGCTKLSKVTLSSKLTVIEAGAFTNCTSLKSITIPSSVKKIGAKTFYKCKKLQNITIKTSKLKSSTVGKKAFSGVHKKVKVKVPKKKLNAYKKFLKKKGLPKKATIKK